MKPEVWRVIQDITNQLDPDPGHARQVCRLSLLLYDNLQNLHGLSPEARDLLKAGALLHDIGWSVLEKPHHKASRDLILEDTQIPFKNRERKIVALITRYHRKTIPKPDHALYSELNPGEQEYVRFCSGILRIADALDRSHQSSVKQVECTVTDDEILITL